MITLGYFLIAIPFVALFFFVWYLERDFWRALKSFAVSVAIVASVVGLIAAGTLLITSG